jgi:hypothetical protein
VQERLWKKPFMGGLKGSSMSYLTKVEILAADDIVFEDVAVPEWGGSVRVKTLTGLERDSLEQSMLEGKGDRGKSQQVNMANFRAKLCGRTIVDENGKRVFGDLDIVDLGKKSGQALQRVFNVASRLSGFSDADIEDLTKNSGSSQSDDSGTA